MILQIGNWAFPKFYILMQVLTKIPLKIQTVLICTLKPFPKFNEIQNLSLDRRQGNKEKYLPLYW